MYMLLMSHTV